VSRLSHPEQLRQDRGRHAEDTANAHFTEKRQSRQANAPGGVVLGCSNFVVTDAHCKLLCDSSDDAADDWPTEDDENKYKTVPLDAQEITVSSLILPIFLSRV